MVVAELPAGEKPDAKKLRREMRRSFFWGRIVLRKPDSLFSRIATIVEPMSIFKRG
jgi:hypothetical protein